MAEKLVEKIALGSVQWGMNYGIANASGRPLKSELEGMLATAQSAGVSLIDTAFAYGEAETVIGELSAQTDTFEIVTKTKSLDAGTDQSDASRIVADAFDASLARLRRSSVYGLMVHNADMLLGPHGDEVWNALTDAKTNGRVQKIGVSVYDPAQLTTITARYQIDITQLPFNIYDRRFVRSGTIAAMKSAGVEVHVRSAFLQGLLLMTPAQLPAHFDGIRDHHARLHAWCQSRQTTPLHAALRFALEHSGADKVVVGAERDAQLREILAAGEGASIEVPPWFEVSAPEIVNPSLWKL
jgi:aryl-alcohol dehydrogenase-like predicted oxidoreductase